MKHFVTMIGVCIVLAACASAPNATATAAANIADQVRLVCPVATVVVNEFASGQVAMTPSELATFQKDAPIVNTVCSDLTTITALNAQNLLQAAPDLLNMLTALPGLSPQAKNNLAALDIIVTVIAAEAKANQTPVTAPAPTPAPAVTPAATTQ